MSSPFKVHAPYDPVPPFEWPTDGRRTWTPPAKSFFGACTGAPSCGTGDACPVGVVVTLDASPYGCDCPCHDAKREEAAGWRPQPRPAVPWWGEIQQTAEWKRTRFR